MRLLIHDGIKVDRKGLGNLKNVFLWIRCTLKNKRRYDADLRSIAWTACCHALHVAMHCMLPCTACCHALHVAMHCMLPCTACCHALHVAMHCMLPCTAWCRCGTSDDIFSTSVFSIYMYLNKPCLPFQIVRFWWLPWRLRLRYQRLESDILLHQPYTPHWRYLQ